MNKLRVCHAITFPNSRIRLFFFNASNVSVVTYPRRLRVSGVLRFVARPVNHSKVRGVLGSGIISMVFHHAKRCFLSTRIRTFAAVHRRQIFSVTCMDDRNVVTHLPTLTLRVIRSITSKRWVENVTCGGHGGIFGRSKIACTMTLTSILRRSNILRNERMVTLRLLLFKRSGGFQSSTHVRVTLTILFRVPCLYVLLVTRKVCQGLSMSPQGRHNGLAKRRP